MSQPSADEVDPLADEHWPDRLSRRGQHLRGQKWQGDWGATQTYSSSTAQRRVQRDAAAAGLQGRSLVGH
jgi:hypothetical protein